FSHHTTYTTVIERYRTTRRSELGFRYRHSRSHRQGPRRGGVPPNRRAILRGAVVLYGRIDVDPRSPGGAARERSHRAVVYLRCDGTGLVVEWADSGVRRLSAGNLHDRPRRRRTEPLSGHGGDLRGIDLRLASRLRGLARAGSPERIARLFRQRAR